MTEDAQAQRPLLRELAPWLAIALAFRLVFLLAMPRVIDSPDAMHYLKVAKQFSEGDFLHFYERIPLLYPALCALAGFATGDLEWAGRIVSLTASVLLIVPIYCWSRSLHGRRVAWLAALIVAIWPWLADYGCRVAPEALASLLWFSAVWAFARCLRTGRGWLVSAPLLFFALHLTRPEGTFLMLAAPVGGLLLIDKDKRGTVRRLLIFVAISAALLALYAVFMRMAIGRPTITGRVPSVDAGFRHLIFERGPQLAQTFTKMLGEVIPVMLGPYLLLFAGVGLFRPVVPGGDQDTPTRDVRLELLLVYFCAVQWTLAVLSTYAEPRYLMPVIIAVSLWSARGLVLVAGQARALPAGRLLVRLPAAGVVCLMLFGAAVAVAPPYFGRLSREPYEYKLTGKWMKENLEPALVLTRQPQIGFYAGMATTGPARDDTPEQALSRAREAGARYLVVDERYIPTKCPGLASLLDPHNAPNGLRLLKDDISPYANGRVVVYEVLPADKHAGPTAP